ncbi:AMP-binding protein [Rhodovulum sp. YEN HP10]|uniref:AMP-binding protein n=1 Tax=Rhodovulum sp. HP10 TaxID=3387397 RepID=UPI0039DFCA59
MYDLTPMQAASWVNGHAGGQGAQGPSAHLYVELDRRDGALDPDRLERAIAALIARHANLRLAVAADGTARILPPRPGPFLDRHDLSRLGALDCQLALERIRADQSHQRLALERGEAVAFSLSLLPGGGSRLHVDLDMIAADPSCFPDLMEDLARLYEDGPGSALPEAGDFAAHLEARRSDPDGPARAAAARAWWQERIAALPAAPELPRPPGQREDAPRTARLAERLDPARTRGLMRRAREMRVTPTALTLALFAQELARACGQPALRLTVPMFHRPEGETPIIGDFSDFALLGVAGAEPDLAALARRVQADLAGAIGQIAHPGPGQMRDLARHLGHVPEAPVVFTAGFDHPRGSILSDRARRCLGDLVWSVSQGPGVALDAQIARLGEGLLVNWDIRLDLIKQDWITRLFKIFMDRLHALADAPSAPESWPLSPLQRAYLAGREEVLPLGGIAMHEARLFRGRLDEAALGARLQALCDAHPALRLRIDADAGRQYLARHPKLPLVTHDLRAAPDAEARLQAVWQDFARSPCPLDGPLDGPLWQVCALPMPEGQEDALAVKFDGLGLDGPAIAQICAELFATDPPSASTPAAARLPVPPPVPAEERAADAAYWAEALARVESAPRLPWRRPPDRPGPARYRRSSRILAPELIRPLRRTAAREGLFLNTLLGFAILEVLARFTPDLRICAGLPTAPALDREDLGNRASFIALEHDAGSGTPRARAAALQARTMAGLGHMGFSGVDLARQLLARTGGPLALPVVLTNGLDWETPPRGAAMRQVDGLTQTPQVALDIRLMRAPGGGIEIAADHAEDVLAPATVTAMLEAALRALESMAETGALSLPDPLVAVDLPPDRPHVADPAPHLLRIAEALNHAQGPALICGEERLDYPALRDRVAAALAGLAAEGMGPGDVLALHLPRGIDHVVLQLTAAMAGIVWVPVDAAAPPARRDYLLDRAAPALIVSEEELPGRRCLRPGDLPRPGGALPDAASLRARSLDTGPGYYLFTSGTTGAPKCVVLSNRATANVLDQTFSAWQVGPEDVLISVTPLHHDMSLFDLFGGLAAGASVVLPAAGHEKDAVEWARLVARHRVTLWVSVPAILDMLLACARPGQIESLRLIAQGGDYIKPATLAELRRLCPAARLISLGGPTETTIWSIWHEIGPGFEPDDGPAPGTAPVPYGRPLDGAGYRICNPLGEPCPPGVTGRIHTLGDCLSLGYLEPGGLSQDGFVTLPGADGTPQRAFRTGDLGQWSPDRPGQILFAGRVGGYVKVRGVRVSLGEIEAALADHPALSRTMVVDLAPGDGRETTLAALYAAREGQPPGPAELRAWLRSRLPQSHLPDRFIAVTALPLSPNGKPDRTAARALALPPHTAPCSDRLGRAVLDIYLRQTGPAPEATIDSPLIDLGLLPEHLIGVAAALNARFGTALRPSRLIPARTARQAAQLIPAPPEPEGLR